MKHILTSGCSFTNNVRLSPNEIFDDIDITRKSWPHHLQDKLGDEFKIYNYGGATNDNVSISRILLYHSKRLISEGIPSKDIIIIGQWSDPNRESIWIKKDGFGDEELQKYGHTLVYTNSWKSDKGCFFLTGGYSPPDGTDSAMEYLGIQNAIKYWEADINWNNIINQTLHWLESWALLEKFCKDSKIKTYWMSMRNPFSQESYECHFGAPENNSDIPSKNIWLNNYEILKPYIDEVPINGKNYWHYKNYNGLLEWSIDNRNDNKYPLFQEYLNHNVNNYDDYLKIQENGWGHPSSQMMKKFVKEELIKHINEGL